MNLTNTKLDLDYVRAQFPAFKDPLCRDWSFFENAGGSYVPRQVIEKLNRFMVSTKVQPYAEYPMSKIAGDNMDKATELFARMINANNKEVIIGGSTSINLYILSNALKYSLKPGDEVIVTNQDHEANISPWRRLSEVGAVIKEWKINPKTAELELEQLDELITYKTKIVCVTHCSNIVGSINDLKTISQMAHKKNAIVIGDGVSYAPHGFPDVKELGVDFYTFSLYKTFGPHLGLLYGKEELLKYLPNQNHEFLKNQYPYTINPGGPNHEQLSSLNGIYEYLIDCYKHHFNSQENNIRTIISKLNKLFSDHEQEIGNIILEYIRNRNDLRLIGKNNIINKNRAPTIAFTHKKKTSEDVSNLLISRNIATRNDNFYAWRCLKALGIDTSDGVVRISLVHYNTIDEVNKLINALQDI